MKSPSSARSRPGASAAARDAGAPARPFADPRAPFLLPLAILLVTRGFFWTRIPFAGEDAYITFRYARNVVRGLGPVYNAGERVLGYTSPVWMFWNALGIALTKDPVVWSRASTVALECAALVVTARLLQRTAGALAAWAFAVFYAGWTFFAATAVTGLETSAMFAVLALTAGAIDRRSAWAGPLLGLVALFRPEGVVVAGVASLAARGRDRAVGLVLFAAGVIALWAYYGSPVPQSLVAKAAVYGTPGVWSGRHWWEWIFPFAFGRWPVTTEGSVLFAMAVVAAPAMASGGLFLARRWREAKGLAALGFASLAVWVGYAALGVAYFAWYLVLPLGAMAVLAAIGLARITRGPWIAWSLALFVAGSWTVMPTLYGARAQAEYESFAEAARTLGLNSNPGQSVFLEPIGMVGWGCKLRIIDEVGLVSPRVAARRKQGDGWMADVIRDERPDWLVTRKGIVEGGHGGAAFAGKGKPFRDDAERTGVLSPYKLLATIHPEAGDDAMEIRGLRLPAQPAPAPPGGP